MLDDRRRDHVALGRALVGPLLAGQVKIGGNPFALLKLLPLMRVPGDDPDSKSHTEEQ